MAAAARIVGGALDRVADIIVARKIAAVGELADLCATVGITLAFAPVTVGLSTLLAGAKIAATRIAFKRILKEMAEEAVAEIVATLTQPAVAASENIVADLAIQTALNVTGVQDGYNADQTAQAGKDGLQLASAGGAGGLGRGGGPEIDHDAHGRTGTKLAGVQISMRDKAGSKLSKAKGHHGRAKGKDSLTAVLDSTIERMTQKLGKGLNDLGEHVGTTLPKAITKSSVTHRETDQDIGDRIKKITSDDGKDGSEGGGRRGGADGGQRSRPASMREAPDSSRALAVSLRKRRCETDPVDVASGDMVLPQTDLDLPGVLPRSCGARTYPATATATASGPVGRPRSMSGWSCSAAARRGHGRTARCSFTPPCPVMRVRRSDRSMETVCPSPTWRPVPWGTSRTP
ncbi:hypothetical protein Y717_34035 [Streptomyces scopuliridis RB72]|uniref:DUF6531 domain-containing protein n=1 Tax=Streptomyces scopuliridis RB72 TaxID=1440053 RepID=A0A2T7SSX5_9ACTN|nr:hypothetical protein Y717_34035 [Streptomyces scopuliridis RB72]